MYGEPPRQSPGTPPRRSASSAAPSGCCTPDRVPAERQIALLDQLLDDLLPLSGRWSLAKFPTRGCERGMTAASNEDDLPDLASSTAMASQSAEARLELVMARTRQKMPVGGGDSIVVWAKTAGFFGIFGTMIALFAFALVRGYLGAQTTGGKIGAITFSGLIIALLVLILVAFVRQRSRMEISSRTIVYVNAKDHTLTLDRESGDGLRVVKVGTPTRPRPGLTIGEADAILPITPFSASKLRQACAARGWRFPDAVALPKSSTPVDRSR